MKPAPALVAAGCGLVLAGLGLVPVRHCVTVEAHPGNPVTRIRVESRSLLAIQRPGWGLALTGAPSWSDGEAGFYLLGVDRPQPLQVRAWPGFRQDLTLARTTGMTPAGLREEGDREAFRTWFVALLEQQLEGPSPAWEPAQRDCAGLLRFAFREALATHTQAWQIGRAHV